MLPPGFTLETGCEGSEWDETVQIWDEQQIAVTNTGQRKRARPNSLRDVPARSM